MNSGSSWQNFNFFFFAIFLERLYEVVMFSEELRTLIYNGFPCQLFLHTHLHTHDARVCVYVYFIYIYKLYIYVHIYKHTYSSTPT